MLSIIIKKSSVDLKKILQGVVTHLNVTSTKKWMYSFLQKRYSSRTLFTTWAPHNTHLNDKSGLITSISPQKHQKKTKKQQQAKQKTKNNNNQIALYWFW